MAHRRSSGRYRRSPSRRRSVSRRPSYGRRKSSYKRPSRRKVYPKHWRVRPSYFHATPQAGCKKRATATLCGSDPNCQWTTRGCVRRSGVAQGVAYAGPMGPSGGRRGRKRTSSVSKKSKKYHRRTRKSKRRRTSKGRRRH